MSVASRLFLGAGIVGAGVLGSRMVSRASRRYRERALLDSGRAGYLLESGDGDLSRDRSMLVGALRRARGKTRGAAKILGLHYRTMLRRMHEQNLPIKRGAPRKKGSTSFWRWK